MAIAGLVWIGLAWKKKCLFDALTKQFLADVVTTNGSAATTNQAVEYFKVFAYPDNGDYAVANADKTIVSLKDRNEKIIWSVKVKKFAETFPHQFECDVRRICFVTNEVWWGRNKAVTNQFIVEVGKTTLGLDRETGRIIYYGSN